MKDWQVYLAVLGSLAAGGLAGWNAAASRMWFPRWQIGFDQGYALAKKHFDRGCAT